MINVTILVAVCPLFILTVSGASVNSSLPSVAFCYAYYVPVAELRQFDWAVVDGDSNFNPAEESSNPGDHSTMWLAYLSVGEVISSRPFYNEIPSNWIIGNNTDWGSKIINQTAPGWSEFFVNRIATPHWNRGFKGFFLDTLDSYRIAVETDEQRQDQQDGLVNVVLALKSEFPSAIVIFNRGFEFMAKVHHVAAMVAFESLYSGWNQAEKKYVSVNENDRNWLLARSNELQSNYNLPTLAIDYCADEACGRDTVNRIVQHNIIPYVTDPGLQTVGIGAPSM